MGTFILGSINRVTFQRKTKGLDWGPVLLTSRLGPVLKCYGDVGVGGLTLPIWGRGDGFVNMGEGSCFCVTQTGGQTASPFSLPLFNTLTALSTKYPVRKQDSQCRHAWEIPVGLLSHTITKSLTASMLFACLYSSITQNMAWFIKSPPSPQKNVEGGQNKGKEQRGEVRDGWAPFASNKLTISKTEPKCKVNL